jgi:hypothetical protein
MKMELIASWSAPAIAASMLLQVSSASASAATQLAFWAQHDEIDYLDNLPRPYSCDELYYKYRDVLLRLGARPGMKIYAYGCVHGDRVASKVRPHVDLTYEIPKALPPSAVTPSSLQAKLQTLHLGPGHPKALDTGDCILVEDMRQTVLASFASHFDTGDPHCSSTHSLSRKFDVEVQTLLPLPRQSVQGETASSEASNS